MPRQSTQPEDRVETLLPSVDGVSIHVVKYCLHFSASYFLLVQFNAWELRLIM